MKTITTSTRLSVALLCASIMLSGGNVAAQTKTTQTLTATVDGKVFESDDDGISLIPVAKSFTVSAITKGFSGYPSPPGLSDRLSIACRNYEGKARKYAAEDFSTDRCSASFEKGRPKQPGGKSEAQFVHNKKSSKSFVEVTKVNGKVIEGKFLIEMTEEGGKKAITAEGTFKAEDRQY
jgi:hypothetical protein